MIFVGGGTMLNYYKELSIKLLLEKEVKFIGNISNPHEIASILRKSDIFVFPSLAEGLPRVILEAMATGLPCIATKVGGIPELLSERCLVEPKDIKGLTGKILEFLNNEELLKEESFKNYNKIINEYTAGKVQENRKNFYQKLRDNAI
jgi:glycosyltransferase involved in cell wall biosynthesis